MLSAHTVIAPGRHRYLPRAVTALLIAATVVVGGNAADAAYPGANGPILFTRDGDIHRGAVDGSGAQNVTATLDLLEDAPAASPDGARIAFQAPESAGGSDATGIWVMPADGGERREVSAAFGTQLVAAEDPTWSPDGTRVAFVAQVWLDGGSRSEVRLYVADVAGGTVTPLTSHNPGIDEPAWSPLGDEILVAYESQLWTVAAGGGEPQLLYSGFDTGLAASGGADWAPDGTQIAFTCGVYSSSVCVVGADGSGVRRLTPDATTTSDPAWSPDGTRIAYSTATPAETAGASKIFTMDAVTGLAEDGSGGTQVTDGGSDDADPNWSPRAGEPEPEPEPQPDPEPGEPTEPFDGDPATTGRIEERDPAAAAAAIARVRFAPAASAAAFTQAGGPRQATWVVLSRDDAFPDSLAGASLTGDGPLLFTATAALSPVTAAEIERVLGPGGRVYLLGGTGAISQAVEDGLTADGYDVIRLSGASRVETAIAVASEVLSVYGSDQVLVARAYGAADNPSSGWADSVSGGAIAAWAGLPMLVTPSEAVHPAVAAWLSANPPAATVLLGGTAALSQAVFDAVPNPLRVSGADRTATAAAIATELWAVPSTGPRAFTVINGEHPAGWAFGLAAAGLASDVEAPLLMVSERVSDATAGLVGTCGAAEVELALIGDPTVITQEVEQQLDTLDGGACGGGATPDPEPDPPTPGPGSTPGAGGAIVLGEYSCRANLTQFIDTVDILSESEYAPGSSSPGVFTYDRGVGVLHFQSGGWAGVYTRGEYYAPGVQGEGQGPQIWLYFDDNGGEGRITCYGPD